MRCKTSIWSALVGIGGQIVWACTPAVAPKPFTNALNDGADVYLYGPPTQHDNALASPAQSDSASKKAEARNSADDKRRASKASAKVARSAAKKAKRDSAKAAEDSAEQAAAAAIDIAGEYHGTDWVTISLPNFPDNEQEDDKARLVLKRLDGDLGSDRSSASQARDGDDAKSDSNANDAGVGTSEQRYSLSVIDTSSGKELCTIVGVFNESVLKFDAGQTCFAGIIGVPMEATVGSGEAHVDGRTLSVEFTVDLVVPTPNGELEGELDYSFEGKRSR